MAPLPPQTPVLLKPNGLPGPCQGFTPLYRPWVGIIVLYGFQSFLGTGQDHLSLGMYLSSVVALKSLSSESHISDSVPTSSLRSTRHGEARDFPGSEYSRLCAVLGECLGDIARLSSHPGAWKSLSEGGRRIEPLVPDSAWCGLCSTDPAVYWAPWQVVHCQSQVVQSSACPYQLL
jgi:hypothetical protein